MEITAKEHWDHIYRTKKAEEVSWTQLFPETSLGFIHSYNLPKTAKIIDIGGGESRLVDYLLQEGFENITVLDISEAALIKVKARLGPDAEKVQWIVSDINTFEPTVKYDVWHDRATFHFLTQVDQVKHYINVARSCLNGYLTIGTFSENGPERCSGLPVKQYSEPELENALHGNFEKITCIHEDHITPSGGKQNFLFCSFKVSQ